MLRTNFANMNENVYGLFHKSWFNTSVKVFQNGTIDISSELSFNKKQLKTVIQYI